MEGPVTVQRGDVVFLRFPFSDGSGTKVRPAVVVQSDPDNARLESTVVALITGNTRLVGKEARHILIDVSTESGRLSGLRYSSAINIHSLFTVHRSLIHEVVGELADEVMGQVSLQLRQSLALS